MNSEQRLALATRRVGQRLKQWQLLDVIGLGGMSVVYDAAHANGKRAAVKVLHPPLGDTERLRRRFQREIYTLRTLRHPSLVQLFDHGTDSAGVPFFAMEQFTGAPLSEYCWSGAPQLSLRQVLLCARAVLDVLELAHSRQILHRDIKPGNLFLTERGEFKVLDFGIAALREEVPDAEVDTRAEGFMGTPAFLPPEQARADWDAVDARSDLWSLGATMFTLLSGELVHDARTKEEQHALAVVRPARSLASVRPDLPQTVLRAVDRALLFTPQARWPSALLMRQEIEHLLATEPDVAAPAMPEAQSREDLQDTGVSQSGVRAVDSTINSRQVVQPMLWHSPLRASAAAALRALFNMDYGLRREGTGRE